MIKLFVSFPSDQPQPVLAPLPRHERHCCLVVDSHSGVGEPEILTAYQKWGTACARYLSGDYAFVLWDGATQRLLAARSITGRCPLYMAQIPSGGLLCASEDRKSVV